VTVYLMQANGPPVVPSFCAGTNPVAVRVAQLNDDNGDGKVNATDMPDLIVVNRGSNDVSILLGKGQGDAWTLTPGPRLLVGNGPMAVDLRDVVNRNGVSGADDISDLVVTNGQDGTLSILPGTGGGATGGFFRDVPGVAQTVRLPNAANPIVPPVIVSANDGFLVTSTGAIINAATQTTIFTSTPGSEVRFVEAFQIGAGAPNLI